MGAIPTFLTNYALHFYSVELNVLLQEDEKVIPCVCKNTSSS